jgi:hypothetical protein
VAIATHRGSCSWDVDHASWVVTLYAPKEQDVSGRTLRWALAWCLGGGWFQRSDLVRWWSRAGTPIMEVPTFMGRPGRGRVGCQTRYKTRYPMLGISLLPPVIVVRRHHRG